MSPFSRPLSFYTLACYAGLGFVSTSCGLYVPTLGPVPLIQQGKQVELKALYRPLTQVEAHVAYSPLTHLLVTGGASRLWEFPSGDSRGAFSQADAGIGYYTTSANKRWYISGLGGYGFARATSRFEATGSNSPIKQFNARYNPLYGQLCLARQGESKTLGTAVRLTSLHYNSLTQNDQPPTGPVSDLYLAYSLFLRVGNGPFQFHVQAGASSPLPAAPRGGENELNTSSPLLGFGVALRPYLLRQRTAETP